MIATVAALAGAALVSTSTTFAGGADAPRDTVVTADNLSRLVIGGGAERLKREIDLTDGSGSDVLDARNYFGYAGIDLLHWLTLMGGGGQVEAKSGAGNDYGDADTSWMAGAAVGLLAHPIRTPEYLAGTLRIDAQYAHWSYEADMAMDTVEWTEDRAALIASMEFPVEHAFADSDSIPFSTVLSVGPVYSVIDGEMPGARPGSRVDFEETDSMGLLCGLDIKFASNWSAGWQGRWLGEDVSHTFSAAFHF
jgi:hypothetical protein